MSKKITKQEFELIAGVVKEACGIYLGAEKDYLVETRLSRILKKNGCDSYSDLYRKIKSGPKSREIIISMVEAITTNETSWFRDLRPFIVMREAILPALEKKNKEGSGALRIWSAACSTGQEPYSLAMTAYEYYLKKGRDRALDNISILATDISNEALSEAKEGTYSSFQINRGMPDGHLEKFFLEREGSWSIVPALKKCINFQQMNLLNPFGAMGAFDVVFLRNVLIYFDIELKMEIIRKIEKVILPGGFLFLGTGETVNDCGNMFEHVSTDGVVYYRKKLC